MFDNNKEFLKGVEMVTVCDRNCRKCIYAKDCVIQARNKQITIDQDDFNFLVKMALNEPSEQCKEVCQAKLYKMIEKYKNESLIESLREVE